MQVCLKHLKGLWAALEEVTGDLFDKVDARYKEPLSEE